MIDINTALTLSTFLNVNRLSDLSGSAIAQHAVMSEPYSRSTGSCYINIDWVTQQRRSGQNYDVINEQKSHLEYKLDVIKATFAMTEEDIAQNIGVGRKTLFNWKRQDSAPNKEKAKNILELYVLAKNWVDAGFSTDSFDLETPVLSGKSIKDMLREPELNSEKILFAGNRLAHQSLGEIDLF